MRSNPGFGIDRTTPYQLAVTPDGVVLTAGQDGKLQIVKQLTLKAPAELTLDVKVTNRSAAALPVSYYLHPEYTVGGAGESSNDIITFPVGTEIVRLPFWTGVGRTQYCQIVSGLVGRNRYGRQGRTEADLFPSTIPPAPRLVWPRLLQP